MSETIEPTADFVESWINTQKQGKQLDQNILELIDKYRHGADIRESELLKGLIALSEQEVNADAPY